MPQKSTPEKTTRNGNTIVYAEPDAKRFHLPQSDSVENALKMSDNFLAVADGLGQRALALASAEDTNLDAARQARALNRNAYELSRIATIVRELCPAEIEARHQQAIADLEMA
jgi:hypothetical protein